MLRGRRWAFAQSCLQLQNPVVFQNEPSPERASAMSMRFYSINQVRGRKEAAMADANQAPKMYQCGACGFVYNEREGLPEDNLPPGTPWANVPEDWTCPDCSADKSQFEAR
jgi:rubredoxin